MTTFATPPNAKVQQCRSCGADVIWIITEAGKRMPVDAAPGLIPGEHTSHFATCPQANDWRKSALTKGPDR